MASGDKVYIADKETLDKVKASADSIWAYLIGTLTSAISIIQTEASDTKTTVTSHNSDMSSRVGESSNDGSAATLFGRLQKIINLVDSVGDYVSSIDSNTRTIQGDVSEDGHIGLTLGNIRTYISDYLPYINDQVAPDYNPDAQGTIPQMLSYIIQNMVSASRFPKAYRSSKELLTGSNTVLDVTGAGIYYGSMANLYDVAYASAIKVTIDGVAYNVTPKSGCTYLCRSFDGAGTPISMSTYDMFQISAPIHFKTSLKIELTISGEFPGVEYAGTIYDLYR